MYADDIKVILLSALLPSLTIDEVLGSEVRFGDGRFRADLVISSRTRLSAIEIKGPRDNLDKLVEQGAGYSSMFLDFSVAANESWLPQIRERVSRSTGLVAIRGNDLISVRAPKIRRRLTASEALKWLRTEDLKRILRAKGLATAGHYHALCLSAKQNISESELSHLTLSSIYERLLPRFETFRKELGRAVTSDDIRMLTLNDKIIGPF